MTRRSDGDGTIVSVGRNRWRVITPRVAGRRSISRTITGSKADARAALAQLLEDSRKVDLSRHGLTLGRFLAEWLADIERSRAKSTHYSYDTACRLHILPVLGAIKLADMTALHVSQWLRELCVGDRTRQNAFKVLRMALSKSVEQRLISHNPTDGIEIPRVAKRQPDPFTASEVHTIVNSLPSSRWFLFIRLGFGTGLRQGEMLGLQWGDIDAAEATIRVERQAVEIRGAMHVTEPKTAAGRRTVPVPEHLIGELIERRRTHAMAIGQAGDDCHVFCRDDGTIPQRSNFSRRHWTPLLKTCGFRHRGFHHARHTWATLQLSAGTPITLVSAILGHSDVSVTLGVYARWMPSDVERARDVGRRMFG